MQASEPPFDPYHIWLAIPPDVRPPNFYQLLGLQTFEADVNVIVNAADQRMRHVKSFAAGPYGEHSQQLLNELSQAKVSLINPQLRAAYDAQLRNSRSPQPVPTAIPTAVPIATPTPAQAVPTASAANPTPAFELKTEDRRTRRRKSPTGSMVVVFLALAGIAAGLFCIVNYGDPTIQSSNPPAEKSLEDSTTDESDRPVDPAIGPTEETIPPSASDRPTETVTTADPSLNDERSSNGNTRQPKPQEPTTDSVAPPSPENPEAEPAQAETIPESAIDSALGSAIGGMGQSPMPQDGAPATKAEPLPLPANFGAALGKSFRDLAKYNYVSYRDQYLEIRNDADASQDAAAISAVDRLEQMESSFVNVWELVHIARESFEAMTEIQSPSGGMAGVVESSPEKLVLRVNGETRRYFVEQRGPMKIFPSMSGELALLLANRATQKSPQAEKSLDFVTKLLASELPSDDAELWKIAEQVWAEDGAPPPKFSSVPATSSFVTNEPSAAATSTVEPNTSAGYYVARFRFDKRSGVTQLDIPPSTGGSPQMEVTRVYLGPTLGVRTPMRLRREIERGKWQVAGRFVKLLVQLRKSDDGWQAETSGEYRRDSGSRFRFEPLSLDKIKEQGNTIVAALKKKRINVATLVRSGLAGAKPLELVEASEDDDLTATINQVGVLPSRIDSHVAMIVRMQQIRDFGKELQEEGWVELRVIGE